MDAELERELREAGVPNHQAPDLAELAGEIGTLPEVKPRRGWSRTSKRRLLKRYDERHRASNEDSEPAKR